MAATPPDRPRLLTPLGWAALITLALTLIFIAWKGWA